MDKLKGGIMEQVGAVNVRRQRIKHVSATIEDTILSLASAPRLYNEEQQQQSNQSLIFVISSCLAMTTDVRITTEGFVCAVVIVMYRVCKSVRLLWYICS
jgi:hypothetical protein